WRGGIPRPSGWRGGIARLSFNDLGLIRLLQRNQRLEDGTRAEPCSGLVSHHLFLGRKSAALDDEPQACELRNLAAVLRWHRAEVVHRARSKIRGIAVRNVTHQFT